MKLDLRWQRQAPYVVLAVAAILNFALLVPGYGEQDAARIFNDVQIWAKSGTLIGADYRAKVLPLYLLIARWCFDLTGDIGLTVSFLAYASAAAATLVLLPLYYIWRRLLGPWVATGGVVVANFTPAFWVAHLYAFPHVIALLFFSLSLASLLRAEDEGEPGINGFHILAAACAAIAATFKADIILCAGGLGAVALLRWPIRARPVLVAGTAVALMLMLPFTLAVFALRDATAVPVQAAEQWSGKFPVVPALFFGRENLEMIARSFGPVFLLLALVGGLTGLAKKEQRTAILLIGAWAVPAVIFWGVRDGNSSRHLMASCVMAAPLVALAFTSILESASTRGAAIAAAVILNYLSLKPTSDTVRPSTRLFESRQLLADRVRSLGQLGDAVLAAPADRKFLYASWTLPYMIADSIGAAEAIRVRARDPVREDLIITLNGGETVEIQSDYREAGDNPCSVVAAAQAAGYKVLIPQAFEPAPRCDGYQPSHE